MEKILENAVKTPAIYDEMHTPTGQVRPVYEALSTYLSRLTQAQLRKRHKLVEKTLLQLGITFNVYTNKKGKERIFPLDIIPRIIEDTEFSKLEKGLKQRIYALNAFIQDVYNDRKILKDKIIPEDIVLSSKGYLPQCEGITPQHGIWCHITGTDLIRLENGEFSVLEDNLRCPSGVSYVLENRDMMKRIYPDLFEQLTIQPVSTYPSKLRDLLQYVSPVKDGTAAVLTPGTYNSAYFEHSFLARQMGIELVQNSDLTVKDHVTYAKTTKGLKKIDVLYRRIDDTYLDPEAFNPDSLLGVPGIFESFKRGNISLVNAPGTGIADDKAVYKYVPDMIQYYLSEDPILNNIETYLCGNPKEKDYVVENLDSLVVKAVGEAGGYGMLIGPHSTLAERKSFKEAIEGNPRNYIAQPTISFSQAPTYAKGEIEGRHVDLRPYILYGEDVYVVPGGLTRVALRKGSLVVNSSQGGGSKDTWVIGKDKRHA